MAQTTGRGRTPSRTTRTPRPPRARASGPQRYSQRVERYAARIGKEPAALTAEERRAARGHRREAVEKKERRERIKREFGVSPERLVKLRRAARAHMRSELGGKGYAPPRGPDFDEVDATIGELPGPMLAEMLAMSESEIRALARLSYEEILLVYPDAENPGLRNPFWYH